MAEKQGYMVCFELCVEAESREQAARFALDDLRDPQLDQENMPWHASVRTDDEGVEEATLVEVPMRDRGETSYEPEWG